MRKSIINLFLSLGSIVLVLIAAFSTSANPLPSNNNSSDASFQAQVALPNHLLTDLQWQENPEIAGVESAITIGDPADSALYVLLGKMSAGATFPVHSHPDDRITTVLSGTMYYGTGAIFDLAQTRPYPAGSIVYTPAGTLHFMQTKDSETVMQETGFGPTGLTFTDSIE